MSDPEMLYLDKASTKVAPEVLMAMGPYLSAANPESMTLTVKET